ncbi:DNA-directed RNA polymerase I RPAC2 [Micractinium conductrix]|uniref:DNA-directed RNA polymerase I RPAC2 n=1 Tax=Micractinium conductrix TaxID=554055 RepID=A0A2P6V6V3_9CHLO|nr:DNA-directed RNA polymerase I RPAC2 [Micractinium conductrix]|eukprot:PSC69823.1 DNA-directed RNA polymerase I RPAC2 [Micractinium conductrix]
MAQAPWLPSCAAVTAEEFSSSASIQILTTSWVTQDVLPSAIPGIVLGAISLAGALFFLVWALLTCCCGRRRHDETQGQDAAGYSYHEERRKRSPWARVFWALLALLTLGVMGTAGWGLAETLKRTDGTVSTFWGLADQAQGKVEASSAALTALQGNLTQLSAAAAALEPVQQAVDAALGGGAGGALGLLTGLGPLLNEGADKLQPALDFLDSTVNKTIADLESKWRGPTMAVEDTWRYVAIAVAFGLLIAVALVAALATWRLSWPATTALLVALLWLLATCLMALGLGVLRSVEAASDGACLQAEAYVVQQAAAKLGDDAEAATQMLAAYLGPDSATPSADPLAPLKAWLPSDEQDSMVDVLYAQLPAIKEAAGTLSSAAADPTVQQVLGAAATQSLQQMAGAADGLASAFESLVEVSSQESINSLYHGTKTYICCDLRGSAHGLWVAWTVCGSLAVALALACSGRVLRGALALNPTHPVALDMGDLIDTEEAAALRAQQREYTLTLPGETHTLGNALRDVMWAHPHVELAAYTQEHPSVNEIILRCQTTGAITAEQGVGEALLMTKDILGHMAGTMDEAVEAWQAAHGGNAAAAAAAAGSRQQQQQQPAAMDEDR